MPALCHTWKRVDDRGVVSPRSDWSAGHLRIRSGTGSVLALGSVSRAPQIAPELTSKGCSGPGTLHRAPLVSPKGRTGRPGPVHVERIARVVNGLRRVLRHLRVVPGSVPGSAAAAVRGPVGDGAERRHRAGLRPEWTPDRMWPLGRRPRHLHHAHVAARRGRARGAHRRAGRHQRLGNGHGSHGAGGSSVNGVL
jgi:hypothetical protein